MNKYWVSQGQPNNAFWGHEFAKHATCTSTFDIACYGPGYGKNQDVVDFFDAVIRAQKLYPTWHLLASYVFTLHHLLSGNLGAIIDCCCYRMRLAISTSTSTSDLPATT